jgi:hypothetical protein
MTNEKRNNMMIKVIECLVIVGFGFVLWGVDSIITKFENKNKKKKDGSIL